ncbi:MAG: exosortase system-associated protein, TIGR04073 family [Nitrosomonadales bacterium]|jgi:putative exosortase-associated protein (TIGR04073 family)|nr:MAG: exosortase system-associated protein, TIGR04073 family [Nitrosomonadales bacterium]
MKKMFKSLLIISVLFFSLPYVAMAHEGDEYPTKVGEKLGNGVANIVTGFVEIPKTMILTSHRDGVAYGITNGFFVGLVHAVGRTLSGVFDVVTFVVPTTPLVRSDYIWNDFDKETTYTAPHMR